MYQNRAEQGLFSRIRSAPVNSVQSIIRNKKLSYGRDSARCGWWRSRSLNVIRCCANRRVIYDFLLVLDSNFTSIFNPSWDIMPSFHIHTLPLIQVELEKDGWEYTLVLGCPEHWAIQHKLTSALTCTVWSQCTHVTDGRTNITAIARRFVL